MRVCTGKALYKTHVPYTRFSHFHPVKNMQDFFGFLLMRHVAFRTPSQLLSLDNPTGCYFYECFLRDIIPDEAALIGILEQYVARQMLHPTACTDLLEKLLNQQPLGVPPDADVMPSDPAATAAAMLEAIQDEFATLPDHPLTPSQQQAFDAITSRPRGLFIINGAAGTGKTYLVQVCTTVNSSTCCPSPYTMPVFISTLHAPC
jgi:hypothetical protein